MKYLNLLVILVSIGSWGEQVIYVNPDTVQSVVNIKMGFHEYTRVRCSDGNDYITEWTVEQVLEALKGNK